MDDAGRDRLAPNAVDQAVRSGCCRLLRSVRNSVGVESSSTCRDDDGTGGDRLAAAHSARPEVGGKLLRYVRNFGGIERAVRGVR